MFWRAWHDLSPTNALASRKKLIDELPLDFYWKVSSLMRS
jgi:hypothetical protein